MNITKQIASEVAEKLIQKQGLEITNLKKELSTKFDTIYLSSIPEEVLSTHKKFPNYFNTRKSFQLSGNGFQYQSINCTIEMPYSDYNFLPNETDSKILHGILNEIENKSKEYKKLFKELEIALFALRTYKKVEENFPEAFLLLPNKTTTAVALNISDLRQRIKK